MQGECRVCGEGLGRAEVEEHLDSRHPSDAWGEREEGMEEMEVQVDGAKEAQEEVVGGVEVQGAKEVQEAEAADQEKCKSASPNDELLSAQLNNLLSCASSSQPNIAQPGFVPTSQQQGVEECSQPAKGQETPAPPSQQPEGPGASSQEANARFLISPKPASQTSRSSEEGRRRSPPGPVVARFGEMEARWGAQREVGASLPTSPSPPPISSTPSRPAHWSPSRPRRFWEAPGEPPASQAGSPSPGARNPSPPPAPSPPGRPMVLAMDPRAAPLDRNRNVSPGGLKEAGCGEVGRSSTAASSAKVRGWSRAPDEPPPGLDILCIVCDR